MEQASLTEPEQDLSDIATQASGLDSEYEPVEMGDRRVIPPVFLFHDEAYAGSNEPGQLQFADLPPEQKRNYLNLLENHLSTHRPGLALDWRIRFQRLAALGANRSRREADYVAIRDYYPASVAQAAAGELWLAQPLGAEPPEDLFDARPIESMPILDGRLDEPFWKTAWEAKQIMTLRRVDDGKISPTNVMLASDDDFLYLGIVCQKLTDAPYPAKNTPRVRDSELGKQDHLTIMIDPDRDHRTAFEFKVDYEGRAWDGIGQQAAWNPQWFVSQDQSRSTWTLEIAIPLEQLGWNKKSEREWWSMAIVRSCPGYGSSQWGLGQIEGHETTSRLLVGLVSIPGSGKVQPTRGSLEAPEGSQRGPLVPNANLNPTPSTPGEFPRAMNSPERTPASRATRDNRAVGAGLSPVPN